MEDVITICPRCSWIHLDGGVDYCNGCGGRLSEASPAVAVLRPTNRAALVADLVLVLIVALFMAMLYVAAR